MADVASLQIVITARGIDDARRQLNQLQQSGSNAARGLGDAKAASEQFNNDLLKLGRTMASVAAVFYTLKNAFGVVSVGIEFNKMIEDSQLSLTALIASLYTYKDASGKVATGVTAFNMAQEDAVKIQADLRIAGLQTAATYQELMQALGQAFAPAKDAGIALNSMVSFVQRFTQVAQTMSIPMNQLNEEIRSFTTGAMQRRTTRVLPFFESIGLGNQQILELVKSGKLYEEFMKRTESISLMSGRAVNTWTVSLSNLSDAFQNIMGTGLEGLFGRLKLVFLELTSSIVQIDEKTRTIKFNPEFLSAIQSIDRQLTNAVQKVRNFVVALNELKNAHPAIFQLGVDVGSVVLKLAALAVTLRVVYGLLAFLGSSAIAPFTAIASAIGSVIGVLGSVYLSIEGVIASIAALGVAGTIAGTALTTGLIVAVLAGLVLLSPVIAGIANKFWDLVKDWEIMGMTIEERATIYVGEVEKIFLAMGIDWRGMVEKMAADWDKSWQNIVDALSPIIEKAKKIITDFVNWVSQLQPKVTVQMVVQAQQGYTGVIADPFAQNVMSTSESPETKKKLDDVGKRQAKAVSDSFWRTWDEGLNRMPSEYGKKPTGTAGVAKPKLPDAGKGGGGGGRDPETEARRLQGIYDRVMQDIARLSEGKLKDINANEEKAIKDVLKYKETQELTEATVIQKIRERAVLQRQKLEEDYAIWAGKISGDITQEWIANARKEYQTWKGFAGAKETILKELERKVKEYNLKQLDAVNEAQSKYLTALSESMPLLSDQLRIQERQLAIQNEQALRKIEEQSLSHEIGVETAKTLITLQEQTAELQKQALERQKWMTEGPIGGLKTWAYRRAGEAEQSGAKSMIDWMGSLEQTTTDTLAAGIVGALNGTREDFAKTGRDIAQAFMEKSINLLTSQLFDQLGMLIMQAFGIPMATLQTNTQSAATVLAMGGAEAGASILQYATIAASVLKSSMSGGLPGSSILSSSGQPMTNPAGGGTTTSLVSGLFTSMFSGWGLTGPAKMASGGIVTSSMLANIGEGGPEAVIPLDRLGAVLGSSGGGGVNVTINNESGTPVDAKDVSFDGKNLKLTLVKMVAEDISRGGESHRAISRAFNVKPNTQRR